MTNLTDYITKLLNGETYQEISNRCYSKGYDEGYAEGYEKAYDKRIDIIKELENNFVSIERSYLEKLLSNQINNCDVTTIPVGKKRWSRKGCCPRCNVHTGSNHNKNCKLLNNN